MFSFKNISLLVALCSSMASFGQSYTGSSSIILQAPLVEQTSAVTLNGSLLNLIVTHQDIDKELYPAQAHVDDKKYEAAQLRKLNTNTTIVPNKKTRGAAPAMGKNFKGNQLHVFVPTDNSIAISKNGLIVSVDNYNVTYADSSGTIIKDSIVWLDFVNNNASFTNGMYDPRVTYDNIHDRFILVILHGPANIAKTRIVTAFSKTNNPMDGWNIYALPGNPLNDTSWADYPNIGVNNNELFINVNLFKGPPTYNYNQTAIYQVSLANGYGGASALDYKVWAGNITNPDGKPGFTLVPAPNGFGDSNTEKDMWFVSTWPDGDTVVNTFRITEELYSPIVQLEKREFKIPKFTVCPNGFIYDPPTGYKDSISTGSSVTQSAFYADSFIHFTFDATINNGDCGIYYGRINLRNNTVATAKYGENKSMLAYPALAAWGHTPKDKSVCIAYLQCDTATYPQVAAITIDDAMVVSTPTLIKKGDTTINMLYPPQYPNFPERWGDYTGIQRKYGAKNPEVWVGAGYAGNNSRKASYNTWIAQLVNGANPLSNNALPLVSNAAVTVFPNPVYQECVVEINLPTADVVNIHITNLQGQIVKQVYKNDVPKGKSSFTFNKGILPAGVYIVNIITTSGNTTNKIVVE